MVKDYTLNWVYVIAEEGLKPHLWEVLIFTKYTKQPMITVSMNTPYNVVNQFEVDSTVGGNYRKFIACCKYYIRTNLDLPV
jgi:hypothetical protein